MMLIISKMRSFLEMEVALATKKSPSIGALGIISGILFTLTVLCGTLLASTITTAEEKKDNFSVVIPISCTMSGTVDTAHAASLQLGTYSGASGSPYANGIGKTTLTTFCTDENGFAIYAIGNTGDVEGTNTMVGTTSGATINTKAYESTDTVSNWAMKITKVTNSSESYLPQNMSILDNYDSWHAVPSSYTKVAHYHATTGSSVTDDLLGAKVETTYAVYVSTDQTPDSYTGQVKYVLVHPYNDVSPDTDEYTTTVTLGANITKVTFTSDITEPQTVKTSGDTVSLYDGVTYTITATTEDGYELASWTTDQYGTIGNATQNPTTFTATGTTTLSATSQPEPSACPTATTFPNVTYMQDLTSGDVSSLPTEVTYKIKDKRDDQTYCVAKLADDKLWMTENLNLAGGTALDADKTDVTSTYISSFSTSNNLTKNSDTIVLPASSTSGFDTDDYSYVYNSGNKTNCGASGQNTPCYSYYSWDAATLGSGRSISTDNTDAAQSICPKGWKLPSAHNGSGAAAEATDFRKLMIGYGGSNSIQTYNSSTTPTGATMYGNIGPGTTPNFLLAGYYYNSWFYDGGSYGSYWSSTSYSGVYNARSLSFNSSNVYSADYNGRLGGFNVRCLFSSQPTPTTETLTVSLDSNVTSVTFSDGTNPDQTVTTNGGTVNLYPNTSYTITATTASGYEFSSWTAGTNATLGSTTTNPTTLTITAATTLSATSHEVTQSSCSSSPMISTVATGITYMQDINSSNKSTVLSALTQDSTYQIKDNRDNQTYCVGKLADGNLWLLDNLALDLTNSTVLSGMNENNTHASNTTLNYLKNGGGTTSDQYAITGVVNWTDSPTYASGYSYSDPLVNLTNKDIVPSDTTSQAGQYKVGGYYNYCAASAGSYCYGNGTSQGTSSGNATEDICPKGWRMPTGDTTGEYQVLYDNVSYNTYANYRSALRLPLSGLFYNGSASNQGSYGVWWSSTRSSNSNMRSLYVTTSDIDPASFSRRSYGYFVRCVLDPVPATETLTVTLDSNTTSVGFYNATLGTQQVTTSGGTVSLRSGVEYLITATTASGYEFSSWTAGTNATIGSTTTNPTTLTVTGTTTLTATSQQQTPPQSSCSTSPIISTVAPGITYMQDINSNNKASVLSSLTADATYQIKDNRDNETYCVGKLADGNLWLLDNLALDLTNSTVLSGMNENNTHASNTTLNYLKNGGGTTSDKYAITGVVNWTDSPTYASSYSYSDPLVSLTNKNVVPTDATSTNGQYKVGGYYNYCAASAGSYCYGNGTSYGTSSGNATEDICPKGWRMPTGSSSGEYQALYNNTNYNTYANYRSALRLPLSDYFGSSSAYYQSSQGRFWSSTRDNDRYMYYLYLTTSYVYPSNYNDPRSRGNSVRCVLGS